MTIACASVAKRRPLSVRGGKGCWAGIGTACVPTRVMWPRARVLVCVSMCQEGAGRRQVVMDEIAFMCAPLSVCVCVCVCACVVHIGSEPNRR